MNDYTAEKIELSLPVNAAYVSAARLTASSIANRLGFDAGEIEDIKAAVSEACIYLIKASPAGKFNIVFSVYEKRMDILLNCSAKVKKMEDSLEGELSVMMIKALMDEMEISEDEKSGKLTITMTKSHKASDFDL